MKNASIRIRLTAEQKAQIEAEARRLGLSVSAFMLSCGAQVRPEGTQEMTRNEELAAAFEAAAKEYEPPQTVQPCWTTARTLRGIAAVYRQAAERRRRKRPSHVSLTGIALLVRSERGP